jgi:hypothetical protein
MPIMKIKKSYHKGIFIVYRETFIDKRGAFLDIFWSINWDGINFLPAVFSISKGRLHFYDRIF